MRKPDLVIGNPDEPYLLRWWVLPRNRWFNIYLHKILRSDDDRALHDHPWWNLSILVKGSYLELRPVKWVRQRLARELTTSWGLPTETVRRRACSLVLRRPTDAHRLIVPNGAKPVWTVFVTGPRVRTWGFHFSKWVPFQRIVDPDNTGRFLDHV